MTGTGGLTLLLIGGYGTFGGRLVRLIADAPRLTVLVAGRSLTKANELCQQVPAKAIVRPVAFDRDGDVSRQIAALKPDLVIDASGPFQCLGSNPYRVVEACVELGISYADLADASAFVIGISGFDHAARQKGIFILSGLSTFPALTFAVSRALTSDLHRVVRITAGVAPSPHAVVGLSVIRSIASYAGRPVPLVRHGVASTGVGLVDSRRMTIAPPGRVPLASRTFSLVDVPDLTLATGTFPGLDAIWVGAGTCPAVLHRAFIGLARLVRIGILPGLDPLAGAFHRAKAWFRWGEDRGGLMIEVQGYGDAPHRITRSWHLIAEGAAGPFIPCFPAEALIRSLLDGRYPYAGARPATDAVRLEDIVPLFVQHRIAFGSREDTSATEALPLYRRMLGEAWAALPASLRQLHAMEGSRRFSGRARVERGATILSGGLARLIGFPAAAEDVPVSVSFTIQDGVEVWNRDFAGQRFSSRQSEGRGSWRHLVVERFGPVAIGLALEVEGRRLRVVVRRWSLFGLPLPLRLAPGGDTYECETDGRFTFHVEIAAPLAGLVVRYRGWLSPET